MDPSIVPSGEWSALLLGPLGALALAIFWIVTLLRDNTALRRQNEQLSDAFIQRIESGSQERARLSDAFLVRHDSTIRILLEHFTWLSNVRKISDKPTFGPRPRPSGEQLATKKTPQPG